MKNPDNRENIFLLICFILVTAISLIVVFYARASAGEPDTDPKPGLFITDKKEVIAKNNRLDDLTIETQKKKKAVNLVGSCPPNSGDFQCPMDPQVTVGNGFKPQIIALEKVSE